MTNHRRKNSITLGLARALTLLCFFHFAGVNNGYTALIAAAPETSASAGAAADLTAAVLNAAALDVARKPLLQTIRSGQAFLAAALSKAQSLPARSFQILTAQSSSVASKAGRPATAGSIAAENQGRESGAQLLSLRSEYSLPMERTDVRPYLARARRSANRDPAAQRAAQILKVSGLRAHRASSAAARRIMTSDSSDGDAPSNRFASNAWTSPSQNRPGASTRAVAFWDPTKKSEAKAVSL